MVLRSVSDGLVSMELMTTVLGLFLYEHLTVAAIAKRTGLTPRDIAVMIRLPWFQEQLQDHMAQRLAVALEVPIANYVTRLERLESHYQAAMVIGDGDQALKCLVLARDEMAGVEARVEKTVGAVQMAPTVVLKVEAWGSGSGPSTTVMNPIDAEVVVMQGGKA